MMERNATIWTEIEKQRNSKVTNLLRREVDVKTF